MSHVVYVRAVDSRNQMVLLDVRPTIKMPNRNGQLTASIDFPVGLTFPIDTNIVISSYWTKNSTWVGNLDVTSLTYTSVKFTGAYPVIGDLTHYLYYYSSCGMIIVIPVLRTPSYVGDRGFYTSILPSGHLTLCDPDYEYYPDAPRYSIIPFFSSRDIEYAWDGRLTREENFQVTPSWQKAYKACKLQNEINIDSRTLYVLNLGSLPIQRSGETTYIRFYYQNILIDGSTQEDDYRLDISLVNYEAYGYVDNFNGESPQKISGFACDSDFPSLIVMAKWSIIHPPPGITVPTSGSITSRTVLERRDAPCNGMPGFEIDLSELYPGFTYHFNLSVGDVLPTGYMMNEAALVNGTKELTVSDSPPRVHQMKVYPPGSPDVDLTVSRDITIILQDASAFTGSFAICDADFPHHPLNVYVKNSEVVTILSVDNACTEESFLRAPTWNLPLVSGRNSISITVDNYASNGRELEPYKLVEFTIMSQINFCMMSAVYCSHGTCHNDPETGSYHCECDFGYTPTPDGLSCIEITTCSFTPWSELSECSDCERGVANRLRTLAEDNMALPQKCFSQEFYQNVQCAFPCEYTIEKYGEPTASNLCTFLVYQYTNVNQYWINQLIPDRNVQVVSGGSESCLDIQFDKDSKKRGTNVTTCSTDPFVTSLRGTLDAEMYQIMPAAIVTDGKSKLQFVVEEGTSTCTIQLLVEPDASGLSGGGLAGIIVAIVISVIISIILFIMYRKSKHNKWLNSLPEYLRFHFDIQRAKSENWKKDGSLYYKSVKPGNKDHERLTKLCASMGLVGFPISESYVLMNELLASNFANTRAILEQRMTDNPSIFMTQKWRYTGKKDILDQRHVVFEAYQKLVESFFWNFNDKDPIKVPVIPLIHGTGEDLAWSIAKKGFASLATLDAGYYGKGIYLTSSARYALPFCISGEKPAFLISFSFPGNIFPVIEPHDGPKTLLGQALGSGYQSNYVLTNKEGFIEKDPLGAKTFYDEVVLGGESQVVPVYLICLDGSKKEELNKIVRETGSAMEARERLTEPEVDLFAKSSSFKKDTLSFFSLPKMGWSKVSEDEDDKYYEL
eukprot:TRINITY_DN1870_c0_g1_i4.p1 TRINITY_DN1870_c0_g1~~TRINITY_DN1870_c0_g1_i4.p1  ORF type:complete len:1073 (-),score=125.77 TRINITY_DN1870_c0_g1_i4:66-3284(-)